ncbi:transcriptional regulator with XRE-family HTH domain [Streptacidiphilus sp. MAP12-33]|uniref:helix-turn-helix domain-containing protein n=1 Tax=Streptacidiphilus sp. MAP12-33 TaxID=3156266 RepID=UPI003518317C
MPVTPLIPGNFGGLLRELRSQAGLTQQELADLAALSVRALRDLEVGRVRQPRRDTVRLLAAALRLEGERARGFEAAWRKLRTTAPEAPAAPAGLPAQAPPPTPLPLPEPLLGSLLGSLAGPTPWPGPVPAAAPRPSGATVGREGELACLVELLAEPRPGLLTVVGLPGVGKRHLVVSVAERLRATGARRVLDERDALGRPDHDEDALVVVGAAAPAGRLVELMERQPHYGFVVTACAPLALPGERLLPLAPLPVRMPNPGQDDAAELLAEPAVRLFLAQARQVLPGFRAAPEDAPDLIRVCHALDGLPLALERAAQWCLLHSPAELADWAEQAPFDLVGDPLDAEPSDVRSRAGDRLDERIVAVLDALPEARRGLLEVIAGQEHGWTVPTLVRELGGSRHGLLRDLHALVLRGLLLGWPPEQPRAFRVPRLVAHVLRDCRNRRSSAAGTADDLPPGLPYRTPVSA